MHIHIHIYIYVKDEARLGESPRVLEAKSPGNESTPELSLNRAEL